jgi:hypothetical protein
MTDPDPDRDRAKPYKGKLPAKACRTAPAKFDPIEFGEPPKIEEWRVTDGYGGLHQVMTGQIFGHPILGDVERAFTSVLVWISAKAGFARTRSRYYRLGRKAPRLSKLRHRNQPRPSKGDRQSQRSPSKIPA